MYRSVVTTIGARLLDGGVVHVRVHVWWIVRIIVGG
jgi:hypothetical protein